MVNDAAQQLKEAQPARQVKFSIPAGLEVIADEKMLRILVDSLLDNAWKFTAIRSEAHIEFGRITQVGSKIFFIRDDGEGFDMSFGDKIFGAFQRLNVHEDMEGTGMGLAKAQLIIQRHGGRIWAESSLDRGATFYFTFE
jgi:light-regulated signal transduction histidine kinase (bacteriophytochrome)